MLLIKYKKLPIFFFSVGVELKFLFLFFTMVYGEGNGNPLQYPYQGNPMDGGA